MTTPAPSLEDHLKALAEAKSNRDFRDICHGIRGDLGLLVEQRYLSLGQALGEDRQDEADEEEEGRREQLRNLVSYFRCLDQPVISSGDIERIWRDAPCDSKAEVMLEAAKRNLGYLSEIVNLQQLPSSAWSTQNTTWHGYASSVALGYVEAAIKNLQEVKNVDPALILELNKNFFSSLVQLIQPRLDYLMVQSKENAKSKSGYGNAPYIPHKKDISSGYEDFEKLVEKAKALHELLLSAQAEDFPAFDFEHIENQLKALEPVLYGNRAMSLYSDLHQYVRDGKLTKTRSEDDDDIKAALSKLCSAIIEAEKHGSDSSNLLRQQVESLLELYFNYRPGQKTLEWYIKYVKENEAFKRRTGFLS